MLDLIHLNRNICLCRRGAARKLPSGITVWCRGLQSGRPIVLGWAAVFANTERYTVHGLYLKILWFAQRVIDGNRHTTRFPIHCNLATFVLSGDIGGLGIGSWRRITDGLRRIATTSTAWPWGKYQQPMQLGAEKCGSFSHPWLGRRLETRTPSLSMAFEVKAPSQHVGRNGLAMLCRWVTHEVTWVEVFWTFLNHCVTTATMLRRWFQPAILSWRWEIGSFNSLTTFSAMVETRCLRLLSLAETLLPGSKNYN